MLRHQIIIRSRRASEHLNAARPITLSDSDMKTTNSPTSENQRVFQYAAGALIETDQQKLRHSLTNCCTATLGAARCDIQQNDGAEIQTKFVAIDSKPV
jgi:hypothetical protein